MAYGMPYTTVLWECAVHHWVTHGYATYTGSTPYTIGWRASAVHGTPLGDHWVTTYTTHWVTGCTLTHGYAYRYSGRGPYTIGWPRVCWYSGRGLCTPSSGVRILRCYRYSGRGPYCMPIGTLGEVGMPRILRPWVGHTVHHSVTHGYATYGMLRMGMLRILWCSFGWPMGRPRIRCSGRCGVHHAWHACHGRTPLGDPR